MIQNPTRRSRLRSTLLILILATLPCYLLGTIILWVGNAAKTRLTVSPTPTVFITEEIIYYTPTLPKPTALFPTNTITPSPTDTVPPTITSTFFIPSPTPSYTPTPSATHTPTPTPIATDATSQTNPGVQP